MSDLSAMETIHSRVFSAIGQAWIGRELQAMPCRCGTSKRIATTEVAEIHGSQASAMAQGTETETRKKLTEQHQYSMAIEHETPPRNGRCIWWRLFVLRRIRTNVSDA